MRGHRLYAIAGLAALFACALIAAGCGDDDSTSASTEATTSTSDGSASEKVDAAVKSCSDTAGQIQPEAAGSALAAACTTVGDNAKQALSEGGDQVDQALAQVASSCKSSVGQLPDGDAQSALSDLCDAIAAE